jgi:hypothetical protein
MSDELARHSMAVRTRGGVTVATATLHRSELFDYGNGTSVVVQFDGDDFPYQFDTRYWVGMGNVDEFAENARRLVANEFPSVEFLRG